MSWKISKFEFRNNFEMWNFILVAAMFLVNAKNQTVNFKSEKD